MTKNKIKNKVKKNKMNNKILNKKILNKNNRNKYKNLNLIWDLMLCLLKLTN